MPLPKSACGRASNLSRVHKKKDLVDKLLSVIIDKETLIEITNYREEVANPMERYLVSKLVNNNR